MRFVGEFIAQASPCEFPIDWNGLNVDASVKSCDFIHLVGVADGETSGEEIPFDSTCAKPSAWRYKGRTTPPDITTPPDQCAVVELCSESCSRLKSGELEGLSFGFGCPPDLL